jgi:hypothetical protein
MHHLLGTDTQKSGWVKLEWWPKPALFVKWCGNATVFHMWVKYTLFSSPTVSLFSSPTVTLFSSPTITLFSSPAVTLFSSPTVTLFSSPTVTLFSSPTVTLFSSPTVTLFSSPTVTLFSSPTVTFWLSLMKLLFLYKLQYLVYNITLVQVIKTLKLLFKFHLCVKTAIQISSLW